MLNISIEKPTVEGLIGLSMDSGLGLDVSKTSTGITVYKDGVLETYQSVPEFDDESDLRYYEMMKALEDDILSLAEGQHFDIIAIEEPIHGENFKTVRMLILLNSVIDKLIGEGKVTCDYFRRIDNTVWKKWLRTLRPIKKYETDKIEVVNIFKYLDYEFAVKGDELTNAEKARIGFQDQLDSLGVLLGAGLERMNSKGTVGKSRKRYKVHVELYGSEEEVNKKVGISNVTKVHLAGNLNASVRNFLRN